MLNYSPITDREFIKLLKQTEEIFKQKHLIAIRTKGATVGVMVAADGRLHIVKVEEDEKTES